MPRTLTFLQLADEFGGTRFGPFDRVEIRLGSDPSRNDITLPESLGVLPEHVRVLKQGDESYILAPVERTAAVFHWRANGGKPKQVTAPLAIGKGDGFSLVTPEGPRFYVHAEQEAKARELAADSKGPPLFRRRLSGAAVLKEIRRQGFAKFATTTVGNWLQWAVRFVTTGNIFNPYYIVMGMVIAGGWLFAGGMSCAALKVNSDRGGVQKQLNTCRDQLGVTDEGSTGDPTPAELTARILKDREWKSTLAGDSDLYKEFAIQMKEAFKNAERYRWVYRDKSSKFTRFKKALESEGVPDPLVRVLAYAAAQPTFGTEKDWLKTVDSLDQEVCGRGPVGLTFRQGHKLGFYSVQPDAFVDRQIAESADTEKQLEALRKTLDAAQSELSLEGTINYSAVLQGQFECIYLEGEDDRLDAAKVADKLNDVVGSRAKNLPRESEPFWIASRLVKLYTYDFPTGTDDLVFDAKDSPSTVIDFAKLPAGRKKYAITAAAEVLARSVAIPCLARFDRDNSGTNDTLGELPSLSDCAVVKTFVEYDRL